MSANQDEVPKFQSMPKIDDEGNIHLRVTYGINGKPPLTLKQASVFYADPTFNFDHSFKAHSFNLSLARRRFPWLNLYEWTDLVRQDGQKEEIPLPEATGGYELDNDNCFGRVRYWKKPDIYMKSFKVLVVLETGERGEDQCLALLTTPTAESPNGQGPCAATCRFIAPQEYENYVLSFNLAG